MKSVAVLTGEKPGGPGSRWASVVVRISVDSMTYRRCEGVVGVLSTGGLGRGGRF